MKIQKYGIIILFFLLGSSANAQTIVESAFKDGIGVRPLGMGGAFTAVADDLNSLVYNPAGLSALSGFTYLYGNADANNEISPADNYTLLNFWGLGFGSWRLQNAVKGSADINAFGFGLRGKGGINFGLTYKEARWSIPALGGNVTKSFDLGFLFKLTPAFNFGLNIIDLIADSRVNLSGSARIGLAFKPLESLVLALDEEIRSEANFLRYGAEVFLTEGLKLRAGSNNGKFCAGADYGLAFLTLQYAYQREAGAASGGIHRIGFEIFPQAALQRPFTLLKPREYALIEVGGNLSGGRDEFSLLGGRISGADSIISRIRRARHDSYIEGIILRISGFNSGLTSAALVQEIRQELIKFKAQGKRIIAYINTAALGDEYYLAAVADKIVIPKGGLAGGIGKSVSLTRAGQLLEKIGLDWEVISTGDYKQTFYPFSKEVKKEQKEMVAAVVADQYRQMVADLAADRKLKISQIKQIGDGRILTAQEAKDLKLVDEIGYFADACKIGTEKISVVNPAEVEQDADYLLPLRTKIAVIEIDGEIVDGQSGSNFLFGGKSAGSDDICLQIEKAIDDFAVRALIVRINSGGGSPIASAQIYDKLQEARRKNKKVIASLGEVAASGGYYIAAAADKIVADPATVTGSIGVIGAYLNAQELLKRIGVKVEVVKEGQYADMFSLNRKLSVKEKEMLKKLIRHDYTQFIAAVAAGRRMSTQEVAGLAEGRIYTGAKALELKLLDKLGNFSDSVEMAAELAGLKSKPALVYYRPRGYFLNIGLQETAEKLGLLEGIFPQLQHKLSEYRLFF